MSEWFVVQCNPQREQYAAERLGQHTPYFPRFKAPTGKVRPLFPSYIFCIATPNWSPIKNTLGVRSLLMQGETPARLPHEVIAKWQAQERNGLVVLPDPPRFRQGERLVVTKGTLKNRTVIHSGMSAREREQVLIEMMGSLVRINIATDDLVSEAEHNTRNSLRRRRETLMQRGNRGF